MCCASKGKWDANAGHRKEIHEVGASEGFNEIRVLFMVRRELVVKANHEADGWCVRREAERIEVLGGRCDARWEIV